MTYYALNGECLDGSCRNGIGYATSGKVFTGLGYPATARSYVGNEGTYSIGGGSGLGYPATARSYTGNGIGYATTGSVFGALGAGCKCGSTGTCKCNGIGGGCCGGGMGYATSGQVFTGLGFAGMGSMLPLIGLGALAAGAVYYCMKGEGSPMMRNPRRDYSKEEANYIVDATMDFLSESSSKPRKPKAIKRKRKTPAKRRRR